MRSFFRAVATAAALILCIPGLSGCRKDTPPQTLGDLAGTGLTVLLPEGGQQVPYLVLAEDYMDTGCALLLREQVLPQPHIFNPNENYGAYYENSALDRMLSEAFAPTLGVTPEQVPVEITACDSLHGQGQDVTTIYRQVFLPSALEAGCGSGRTFLAEGQDPGFFEEDARRIAMTETGEAVTWWLRTPGAWYDNVVCCVNSEGVMVFCGLGDIIRENSEFYVRPALCLSADLPVKQRETGEYELNADIAG